jgi:adenylate kinase family enzyme
MQAKTSSTTESSHITTREPLIEYYTKAGKYNEVDGVGTIEEVRDRIFTIMDRF